jgi:L-ascorbate metabolism protein UlaG (beta-lactamase superfamily)
VSRKPNLLRRDVPISGYSEWSGEGLALWWLGQAGFLLRFRNMTIVIDAYLSDTLAMKYKGQVYPHRRMMQPPIAMDDLTGIDYCMSSHSHSDHMDPGLIPVLRDNNPGCRFIVPEAARKIGLERGVPAGSLIGVDAGGEMSLGDGITVSFIPSAHETLSQDSNGHHFFLGFVFRFDGLSLYHPGDCLPYPGLDDRLEPYDIDLALMPVNGRKEELSRRGIPGNFDFVQARDLVNRHDIRYMIPHHYGMFNFNTLARDKLERMISESAAAECIFPAETGIMFHLTEGA